MSKVPIQKGKINCAEKTIKTMTHAQAQAEKQEQMRMLKDSQTLKLHVPKK